MQKTILFDTNVLIDFWKNSAKLKELELSKEKYAICGVVRSEFLHGAKSNSEIDDMLKIFASFSNLPNDDYDFDGVGFMLQNLRKNSYTIPFSDAMIAFTAIKYDVPLWTHDRRFEILRAFYPELILYEEI